MLRGVESSQGLLTLVNGERRVLQVSLLLISAHQVVRASRHTPLEGSVDALIRYDVLPVPQQLRPLSGNSCLQQQASGVMRQLINIHDDDAVPLLLRRCSRHFPSLPPPAAGPRPLCALDDVAVMLLYAATLSQCLSSWGLSGHILFCSSKLELPSPKSTSFPDSLMRDR